MITCHHLHELPGLNTPLHLALGVFDGVHIGHQAVIQRAVDAAKRIGGLAGVLTFDPHPIRVIAPAKAPSALLATLDHKADIVAGLGAQLFIPLHFDAQFAKMGAAEFLEELTRAPIHTIAVGEDWRFGKGRLGDVSVLAGAAKVHGFQLEAVPPVMTDGDRVSSTRIRQAIRDGNLADAARMLGRPHSVIGKVIEGRKLGRQLGFPTANLATGELQTPPDGVWSVRVTLPDSSTVRGIANLGYRPTVDGTHRLLEVHLFDFSGNLYGAELEVQFTEFIRPEMKFDSVESLRFQIAKDIENARLDT
ncbi:bifunctional riboflavin kinase/FAD synthetase [Luteolibacter pohnpeiensis]|uniref:Riboflavin biosynthesis protein n=1 Tax=Luteolibacter pohnpeiensis TaxID=454153 RepID=A0A934VVJ2_9BACT|nr:bifunctional riboflavin kinase/FAD synthetase [Luteolibacter pohnpeiensis]MBK1881584.1 bifunctional riboflavin kinase/FAD synthetase [Luteolibacter pohnpeiensis]